jgi:hypothetical protein
MMKESRSDVDVARLIWFAMLAASVLYAILAVFVRSSGQQLVLEPAALRWLSIGASVLAGTQLLVLFVFKQLLVKMSAGRYRSYCILRYAWTEAIAIYGLIQAFMGQGMPISLAFIGFAFMMLLTMAPSDAEAEEFQSMTR